MAAEESKSVPYVLDDEKDEIILKIPNPEPTAGVPKCPLPGAGGTNGKNQSTGDPVDLTPQEQLLLLFKKQANARRAMRRFNKLDVDSVKPRIKKGYEYAQKALKELPEQIANLKDIIKREHTRYYISPTRVMKGRSNTEDKKICIDLSHESDGELSQSRQQGRGRENGRNSDQGRYRTRSPKRMGERSQPRDRSSINRSRSRDNDRRERRGEYRYRSPERIDRSYNRKRMTSEDRILFNRSWSTDKSKQDDHRSARQISTDGLIKTRGEIYSEARREDNIHGEPIKPKLEYHSLNEPSLGISIAGPREDQMPLTKEERKQMLMKKIEEARREISLDYQNLSNLGKSRLAFANNTIIKQPILVDPKGLWTGSPIDKPAIETSCNQEQKSREQIQLELENKILALLTPNEDVETQSPKNMNWKRPEKYKSQIPDRDSDSDVEPPPPTWQNPAEKSRDDPPLKIVNAPRRNKIKNYKLTVRRCTMIPKEMRTLRDQRRFETAQKMLAHFGSKEGDQEEGSSEKKWGNNDLNWKEKAKKDLNLSHPKNAKGTPRQDAISNECIPWETDLSILEALANSNWDATSKEQSRKCDSNRELETRPTADANWNITEGLKEKSPIKWESFSKFQQNQTREVSVTDPGHQNAWGPDPSREARSVNTNHVQAQVKQGHRNACEEPMDMHVWNPTRRLTDESRLNSEAWEEDNTNGFWNPTREAQEEPTNRWNSVEPREISRSTSAKWNQTRNTQRESRGGWRGFERNQSTEDNRSTMQNWTHTMEAKEGQSNECHSTRGFEQDLLKKDTGSTPTKSNRQTSNPNKPRLKVRDDLAAGKNWVDNPTKNKTTVTGPKDHSSMPGSHPTDKSCERTTNTHTVSNTPATSYIDTNLTQTTEVKEVRATKWDGTKWVDAKVFDEMNKAKTNANLQVPVVSNSADDETLTPEQLQVSIVDGNSPGKKLEPEQWEFVEKKLLQLLDEVLIRTSGPYPIFDQMTTYKGFKILACCNKFTFEWLKANVSVMRGPWPGARLNVMTKKDLPTGPFVKVLLPGPPISKKRLEQFMRNLNPEYPCENWYVMKITDNIADNGQEAIVLFNEESIALLPDRGYKIRVGISVVKVYPLDDDGNVLPEEKPTLLNPFRPDSLNEETKKDSDTESKKSECWDE